MLIVSVTKEDVMTVGIVIGALLGAVIQLLGHWFRWEVWLGQKMHTIMAYAWGVAGILTGVLAWAMVCRERTISTWMALLAVVIITGVSGAATLFSYAVDALGERVHYARSRETMDAQAAQAGQ